ncbi:MAG: O-methyltransferase [Thaumarchaeota archaeon]|nr:O-methyltransferase [Nitrososphaerota archaeon]
MSQDKWAAVDRYLTDLLVQPDSALDGALKASVDADLPPINVSPPQGKFLHILAKVSGAKRILEIGTLGGYSTIWLARALPSGGRLISLEIDPAHAAIAAKNIARAGLSKRVHIRLGSAIDTLPKLLSEGLGPFDLIFIDADKPSNPEYFAWALRLSRKGSIIVIDNVVRNGAVVDAKSRDASVMGVRRLNQAMAVEKRVIATTLQTVGSKGYDGFAVALVVSD